MAFAEINKTRPFYRRKGRNGLAHELLQRASLESAATKRMLSHVLAETPEIVQHLSPADLPCSHMRWAVIMGCERRRCPTRSITFRFCAPTREAMALLVFLRGLHA